MEKNPLDIVIEECNAYLSDQTKQFNSIGRKIVYVVIATIWAFSFHNGSVQLPVWLLCVCLCFCLLYLFTDLLHYFIDTRNYHKEGVRLQEYKLQQKEQETTQTEKDNKAIIEHEKRMTAYSKISSAMVIVLFIEFCCIAISFVAGIIQLYLTTK